MFVVSVVNISLGAGLDHGIAAERLKSEMDHGVDYGKARVTALPGMMTGQILSGVEPVIAARYQIMVMCMIFGSAGISAMLFLVLISPASDNDRPSW